MKSHPNELPLIAMPATKPLGRRHFLFGAIALPAGAVINMTTPRVAQASTTFTPSYSGLYVLERRAVSGLQDLIEFTTLAAPAGSDPIPEGAAELLRFVTPWGAQSPGFHVVDGSPAELTVESGATAIAALTWEMEGYVYHVVVRETDFLVTHWRTAWQPGEGVDDLQVLVGAPLPRYEQALSVDHYEAVLPENLRIGILSAKAAFGKQIGTWRKLPVYSNEGNSTGDKYGYNSVGGTTTGLKWHCAEWVNRVYLSEFKMNIRGGNANEYFKTAKAKKLRATENGGSRKPEVGDIIVSEGGGYGHVAIVTSVGSDSITVIHQNWSQSDPTMKLTLTRKVYTDRSGPQQRWTVGNFSKSYPVRGWVYK